MIERQCANHMKGLDVFMAEKSRRWVSRDELDTVRKVIQEHLGDEDKCVIPFDKIVPLLQKEEITRLLWCRTARNEFVRWGLKLGVRHSHKAYVVRVIDRLKWNEANSGNLQPTAIGGEQFKPQTLSEPLSAELVHLVPEPDPNYVFPLWSQHLKSSMDSGDKVLLVGPTGSGKSSLIRELAARQGKPFLRINLNGESSVSDILGGWKVQGREMVFRYGPVPMAVRSGALLCLDELDAALPAVLFALQGLLEDGGSLQIPDTGEWIKPHDDFRLVATANTLGKGDDSGLYAGTNVLNEAFLDRFHTVFHVDYLSPSLEQEVIRSKAGKIDPKVLARMLHVAGDLRKALSDGIIFSTCSTRKLIAWARKTVQLGDPIIAAQYTIINKLSDDDKRVVSEVLQRHGLGENQ
jgi:MoxR-like ATPase